MEEEPKRRNSQNSYTESSAAGGWTNTTVAGKALGVSPRTVLSYIKKGLLEGKAEGEGVKRTWYVSIDSLNALRTQRLAEESIAENFHGDSAEGIAEVMQNISMRLAEESAKAAEFRIRLELTERAESTLREALEREREKADQLIKERQQAQEEANRLRAELEAERSKGFWRRLFGG